jgi:hypothetical protein
MGTPRAALSKSRAMALFTPMTRPDAAKIGPPLPPTLVAAS